MQVVNDPRDTLVSIITVSYNSCKTIERTIKSVTGQTYRPLEYNIIDGGSGDGTVDIIKKYAREFDFIHYISEPDNGIYDAMNKGIKKSSGEIIGIINSDDWYETDAAETVVRKYIENKKSPGVYYGAMGLYNKGAEKAILFYNHAFLPERMINHPSCFVTRDIYERYGLFDLRYRIVADYELMLRLYYKDSSLFYPIYDKMADFSEGSLSGSMASELETDVLLKEYGLLSNRKYVMRKAVRTIKKWLGY
ncbi:MAG: glycosyltransferase [Lachnospiraceae bacterium]|nr:glycosyltransferase [Lachnospiraceae bacterium]